MNNLPSSWISMHNIHPLGSILMHNTPGYTVPTKHFNIRKRNCPFLAKISGSSPSFKIIIGVIYHLVESWIELLASSVFKVCLNITNSLKLLHLSFSSLFSDLWNMCVRHMIGCRPIIKVYWVEIYGYIWSSWIRYCSKPERSRPNLLKYFSKK